MFCDVFESFSPIAFQFIVVAPNKQENDTYGARVVEHYELEYISTGAGRVIVDGEAIPACDHSLHFRRPGMHVEGIGIYHSHYIEFDFNQQRETPGELEEMPSVFFLEEYAEVERIFHSLFQEYFDEDALSALTYKIHVLKLFEFMVKDWYYRTQDFTLSAAVIRNIQRSITYIQSNLSQPITLSDMAESSGYSLCHFARMFKSITTQTPVQYLTHLRINCAKRLLAETEKSSEKIYVACGFNSYSYFFRTFKKFCGITPYQYRRRHRHRSPMDDS